MTRHNRRNSVWLTLIVILMLLLAACGPEGDDGTDGAGQATQPPGGDGAGQATQPPGGDGAGQATTPPEDGGGDGATTEGTVVTGANCPEGATPVTFWTSHGEPDLSSLRNIVNTYNEQNQDSCVRLVQVPGAETEVTKLLTAVRGGVGPDIYMLDRFIVAQRAADGLLQDLTQYSGGEDPLEGFIDFARAEASFNGKPYALPFDTDTRALAYNIDMLEAAGVDTAPLNPENGPITWDQLAEMAAKLDKKDANGNFSQMGFVPYLDQGWHYTYGFSFGGEFFDAENCEVTPDHPQNVAGMQWAQDYIKERDAQKVQAFSQPFTRQDLPPQQHPFMTGRVAFTITGDWFIGNMETYAPNVKYDWTYIPVPNEGDESVTWAGGWSMVIPQGAKEPEAAYKFMQYITGEEGQRTYVKETRHQPTIEALGQDQTLFEGKHKFFPQLLDQARSRPPLPVGALYWDELTNAWKKIYLNEAPAEQALKEAKGRVQPRLERFCDQMQQQG